MFFLINEKVIIATPDVLEKSDKTIDMSAEELSQDYEIQKKAKMATAVLIKPDAYWAEPLPSTDMREYVARYLASLKSDNDERDNIFHYIEQNNKLRILFV